MTSVRVTISIKSAIIAKVMARAFDGKIAKLAKDEHDIAKSIHKLAFTDKEHKTMKSLPKGWLPNRAWVQAKFEEGSVDVIGFKLEKELELAVPYSKNNYTPLVIIELGHDIEKAALKLLADKEKLTDERNKARASVNAILDSVTTVGKLLDVWPEARDFILPYLSKAKCTLPAIQFKEVNKMLGLPPKKK